MVTQRGPATPGGQHPGSRRPRRIAPLLAAWGLPVLVVSAFPILYGVRAFRAESAPAPLVGVDYTLDLRSAADGRLVLESDRGGPATLLLWGLSRGGSVSVLVNGTRPSAIELLASGGQAQGRADCALVTVALQAGPNEIHVTEADGVQVVRAAGTNRWFATSTQSGGNPVFGVNLDDLKFLPREYPVQVNFGPAWEGFLWFSARWDKYYGTVYVDRVTRARGSSGAHSATLSFVAEYAPLHLVMPTHLTLIPEPIGGAFTIRVHQGLRALGEGALEDGTEFLHIKITDNGAVDWQDGTVDYTWYRSQTGDCVDAAPGSHTGMVRMDDNSFRVYAYRSSSSDPGKTTMSAPHHTGAASSLGASNTIGGFITKTGVGSCGWVFHAYQANFRDDVVPIHGHCGDGADTHFFAAARELFCPFPLKAGDVMEVEYSLSMLPSEVTREEIEDLNEADLHLFGTAAEQSAPVSAWLGTKDAVGLLRGDGSMILLGLGPEAADFPVPPETLGKAITAYRLFGLVEPTYEYLDLSRGTVGVRPGWVTVVDCGAALWEPVPEVGYGTDADGEAAPFQFAALLEVSGAGPIEGMLRRK